MEYGGLNKNFYPYMSWVSDHHLIKNPETQICVSKPNFRPIFSLNLIS